MRIITKSVTDCYRLLGVAHTNWRPLPGRIKDYIASPKPDGYQSLHTGVFIGDGNLIEIQIRTEKMHKRAELVIESHDYYKKREKTPVSQWFNHFFLPTPQNIENADNEEITKKVPDLVKRLVNIKFYASSDTNDTGDEVRNSFLQNRIFVWNQKGEVFDLPKNATVADFILSANPDQTERILKISLNGKTAGIKHKLRNGDTLILHLKKTAKTV